MIQNAPYSKKSFINSIDSMSELDKIKLKNNVNKIITAYKKHKKKKYNQNTISQYINENITTDMGSPGI